jgi:hypothetical protein
LETNEEGDNQWLEQKEQEFSQKENKNPRLKNKQWLQRYVYTDLHEIFFGEFPNLLAEWMEIFVENTGRHRPVAMPKNWTPELVRQVDSVDNRTSHAVEFWLDSILGGYITKFSIDCTQAYSVTERDFFKGHEEDS